MDDLMKCLYDFVCKNRMGCIYEDPEYEEAVHSVELQAKKLQDGMTSQQKDELELLLNHISAQYDMTNEHLFQATLRLARELHSLA